MAAKIGGAGFVCRKNYLTGMKRIDFEEVY
jgi:hypothetical protein